MGALAELGLCAADHRCAVGVELDAHAALQELFARPGETGTVKKNETRNSRPRGGSICHE